MTDAVLPADPDLLARLTDALHSDLHRLGEGLTRIARVLTAGAKDTELMIRLATSALRPHPAPGRGSRTKAPLRQVPPVNIGAWQAHVRTLEAEKTRHTRGLEALKRHLEVGGTDVGILIGLTVNALTGYTPATAAEARQAALEKAAA